MSNAAGHDAQPYIPREMEIIPPRGRVWRIRHRTRAERLRDGALTAVVMIVSLAMWAMMLGPLVVYSVMRVAAALG